MPGTLSTSATAFVCPFVQRAAAVRRGCARSPPLNAPAALSTLHTTTATASAASRGTVPTPCRSRSSARRAVRTRMRRARCTRPSRADERADDDWTPWATPGGPSSNCHESVGLHRPNNDDRTSQNQDTAFLLGMLIAGEERRAEWTDVGRLPGLASSPSNPSLVRARKAAASPAQDHATGLTRMCTVGRHACYFDVTYMRKSSAMRSDCRSVL